jgi:hypothetical protein
LLTRAGSFLFEGHLPVVEGSGGRKQPDFRFRISGNSREQPENRLFPKHCSLPTLPGLFAPERLPLVRKQPEFEGTENRGQQQPRNQLPCLSGALLHQR